MNVMVEEFGFNLILTKNFYRSLQFSLDVKVIKAVKVARVNYSFSRFSLDYSSLRKS